MQYEFLCECGQTQAIHLPASEAPEFGSARPCPGCGRNTLKRVVSLPVIADARLRASWKYPYPSYQHQGLPGCRENADGHSMIENPQHEREVCARTGMVRD